ncbi:hypothetical protein D3C73_730340 [compost metagenome]
MYRATSRYGHTLTEYECTLFQDKEVNEDRPIRNITLNFPLYQGVEEVWIGVDHGSQVTPPSAYENDKKIILYGTSITQGGCATRPGMAYPNIISRRINQEFINMGFSGSGRGEPELAHILAEIADPACLILDYEANCGSVESLQETLPEFIRIYRDQHPLVPILVVSQIVYAEEAFHNSLLRLSRKQVQIDTVERYRQAGDNHIHFFDGSLLLGEHAHECTVDGVHPTDLGFLNMANGLTATIRSLLSN